MRYFGILVGALLVAVAHSQSAVAASSDNASAAQVVSEATGGKLKATKGKYFEKSCNEQLDYDAEVVDLNGDGQPEVFTNIYGTCMGGMAGVDMNLYIKNKKGQWIAQFGFPGTYKVLKTKSKGYPDIEIGGPGFCFPVWRWNGHHYKIHKKCPS
jgi:uncharacterized low-complexity protein